MGEIDNKLLYQLILGFVAATILGTLIHESGHFFTAKYLGYEARISYGYTTWKNTGYQEFFDGLTRDERIRIRTNEYFARKEEYQTVVKKIRDETLYITLGGPLLTIVIGMTGFLLCMSQRKYFRKERLLFRQWVLIFISLFWLRETGNYVLDILFTIKQGRFPYSNDEAVLARYFGFDTWSVSFVLALIGFVLMMIVYKRCVPEEDRTTFVLAGLLGGMGGYLVWLLFLGPIILP